MRFQGQDVEIGDWVQYDVMEGRQFTIDCIHCRRLKDTQLVMECSLTQDLSTSEDGVRREPWLTKKRVTACYRPRRDAGR